MSWATELTPQGAFNTMVAHLRKQGRRSQDDADVCKYRGPDGTMCAVGCLIPDDEYREVWEGRKAYSLYFGCEGQNVYVGGLLHSMQEVHDSVGVYEWEVAFESVARVHGLELEPLS